MGLKKFLKFLLFLLLFLIILFIAILLIDKLLNGLKAIEQEKKENAVTYIDKDAERANGSNGNANGNSNNNSNSSNESGSNGNGSNGKNIVGEYDPFNFDDTLLLYEGKQKGTSINKMLERIISNADQNLFSYVKVSYKNIGNGSDTISFTNKDEYVSRLNDLKSQISDGEDYIVSFGYNSLRTYVNEIIIEK